MNRSKSNDDVLEEWGFGRYTIGMDVDDVSSRRKKQKTGWNYIYGNHFQGGGEEKKTNERTN